MRRKALALALVLLVLVSVLPPGLAAEATGKVVFESGPEDANGVFTVTMKGYDMLFWVAQFALKYDKDVIQPVDAQGNPTEKFSDFAGVVQPWTEVVNEDLYPDIGLLGSCVMVSLDVSGEGFDDVGDAFIGSEGVDLFTFRFKRLKEGDTGLEIASKAKGDPWQEMIPEGMLVMNLYDDLYPEIIFREAANPESGKSEQLTAPVVPAEPEKTADELLDEAVILKIGSHAAAVKGNVAAIYYGERDVTAYAHDNRTFVPVRFVGERLGATVGWINETQTVTVEKDGHKIEMPIGSSTYTLDGETKTLDAPAELTPSTNGNSRTMVPIRFVTEALGYQVEWDQARNLVVIVPQSLGWDPKGETEAQAMDDAVTKLAMYSKFV